MWSPIPIRSRRCTATICTTSTWRRPRRRDLRGAAAGGLKLRAEGALAQSLVRPEWRTEGGDWDAVIQEVDAGRLVASDTMLVNGWMGPRWVRSGWFHAYRLLAEYDRRPGTSSSAWTPT